MSKNKLTYRISDYSLSITSPYYISYKFLISNLEQAIIKYAKGRVSDIGCGNKPFIKLFKNYTKYIGCDIEQSQMKLVDIIFDATNITVSDDSFDTVFCTQMLEHVFDHNKVIAQAYRILKPGGVLIASVPMCWPLHEEPNDFFRFTKYGIELLLKQNNFKVEYIKANDGKWALLGNSFV